MNRFLIITLLLLASPAASASLVTLTGGSLTAYATAGDNIGINTDNPASISPSMGFSSLSASANGYKCFGIKKIIAEILF